MAEKIGEFLVKIGVMTQAQVDHVLELQGKGDSRIFGEIALELSYINDEAIRKYVDALEKFKKS